MTTRLAAGPPVVKPVFPPPASGRGRKFAARANPARSSEAIIDVTSRGVIGDGQTNITSRLRSLVASVSAGQTLFFPKGDYSAPAGTIIYIDKPIKLRGEGAKLVNVRLFFMADADVDGLTLTEVDCVHDQKSPATCPVSGAMITAGYVGYPLDSVSIRNVNISTTRAYTAIEFGYDRIGSATIDHFKIVDHELSGISIYGGKHIRITNGTIRGGAEAVVDDGIALSPYYGPISDVAISNVSASQTADLVGIGSDLFWPLTNVSISQSSCDRTLVCLYFRLGDAAQPPAPYAQYSYVDGITVDGVMDTDSNGERYQASIMLLARGGATGRNIVVSGLVANARAASPYGFRVQAFLEGGSKLQNVILANCRFDDSLLGLAHSLAAPGFPMAEGIFLQSDAASLIDRLTLTNIHLAGTAYWGIDAGSAQLTNLQMINSDFTNVFLTQPDWKGSSFYISPSSTNGR